MRFRVALDEAGSLRAGRHAGRHVGLLVGECDRDRGVVGGTGRVIAVAKPTSIA